MTDCVHKVAYEQNKKTCTELLIILRRFALSFAKFNSQNNLFSHETGNAYYSDFHAQQ